MYPIAGLSSSWCDARVYVDRDSCIGAGRRWVRCKQDWIIVIVCEVGIVLAVHIPAVAIVYTIS